jgi:hypothetical membrane protein
MNLAKRLWSGPAAAALLALGIFGLALLVPGYNQVRQTVSEIGEQGSPERFPFAVMLSCVGVLLLVFASAVGSLSRRRGHSTITAWIIGFMAVPCIGLGIFAYPHPLHNVFGLLELIGYQAPIAMALSWRNDPDAQTLVRFSWIFAAIVWLTILLNLTTFHRYGTLWADVKPIYGLIQRSLFAAWFLWCIGAALLLRKQSAISPAS